MCSSLCLLSNKENFPNLAACMPFAISHCMLLVSAPSFCLQMMTPFFLAMILTVIMTPRGKKPSFVTRQSLHFLILALAAGHCSLPSLTRFNFFFFFIIFLLFLFCYQFPNHNFTLEALWPGLFVDKCGNYWDVPFSMAADLASVASDSGPSYHLTMHHNSGLPTQFEGDENSSAVPASLLPGFSLKNAVAYKKNVDIWRSKAQKLKMVQPYDIFLSSPHVSASGIIGKIQSLTIFTLI